MRRNKDNPYKNKEEAIVKVRQWISEHCHEYPNTSMRLYSIYPFTPTDCKVIVIVDERTHRTIKRIYFKESEV